MSVHRSPVHAMAGQSGQPQHGGVCRVKRGFPRRRRRRAARVFQQVWVRGCLVKRATVVAVVSCRHPSRAASPYRSHGHIHAFPFVLRAVRTQRTSSRRMQRRSRTRWSTSPRTSTRRRSTCTPWRSGTASTSSGVRVPDQPFRVFVRSRCCVRAKVWDFVVTVVTDRLPG